MTEDIAPDVLKKTQDTLGKFIKKPVLTEKLLKKPPFRFLHDICTAAMKETGFFEGVLSGNDTKAENIKDKEAKIAFLQKVIAAVESATSVKLSVKPNKVVAGHEPLKTNEFLQALANALEKQVEVGNSKTSFRKSKPQNSEIKQEENVKKKNAVNKVAKTSEIAANVPLKDGKGTKSNEKQPTGNKAIKKLEKDPHEGKSKKKPVMAKAPIENEVAPATQVVNGDAHSESKVEELPVAQESVVETALKSNAAVDQQNKEVIDRPPSAKVRAPSARPASSVPKVDKVPKPVDDIEKETDGVAAVFGNSIADLPPPTTTSPEKVHKPLSPPPTVAPKEPPPPSSVPGKKEGEGIVTRPRTAIRPPTARPASARPAAPRVRDRGQLQLQEEIIKPAAGKVNLIVEQEATVVDEDELVAVQTTQTIQDVSVDDLHRVSEANVSNGAEHGHLVSQILEAQRELEDDSFGGKKGGQTEIEWSTSRGAEATNKDVERLRSAIQTLTRSVNPLGKLLEFVGEDVDTMHQELEAWQSKNSSLSAKLEQERSLTDMSIEPLKGHLDELQHSINQQMEQIAALKATVLRNDQKIVRVFNVL